MNLPEEKISKLLTKLHNACHDLYHTLEEYRSPDKPHFKIHEKEYIASDYEYTHWMNTIISIIDNMPKGNLYTNDLKKILMLLDSARDKATKIILDNLSKAQNKVSELLEEKNETQKTI